MKRNNHDLITNKIIEALDAGTAPWCKPWATGGCLNLISGKAYRGINTLLLGMQGYKMPFWVTYKQAQSLGGTVKKGERGTHIIYYRLIETSKTVNGTREMDSFPMMRVYSVFNVDQTEGITHKRLTEYLEAPETVRTVEVNNDVELVVDDYLKRSGVTLTKGGNRAFYRPASHSVAMPPQDIFKSDGEYYHTTFHELGHSTGHKTLLNRDGVQGVAGFGSKVYSKEELIAELTACFVCTDLSVMFSLDNSASYIDGWRRALSQDNKLIFQASTQAQKATDLILNQ